MKACRTFVSSKGKRCEREGQEKLRARAQKRGKDIRRHTHTQILLKLELKEEVCRKVNEGRLPGEPNFFLQPVITGFQERKAEENRVKQSKLTYFQTRAF